MRRAFGLLTMLGFLNLMSRSSGLVCENHVVETASSHSTGAAAHHHGQPTHLDHAGQTGHTGHEQPSGGAPSTEPCCPAMASCGLVAVAAAEQCVSTAIAHDVTPSDAAQALLTRATAPETPPPRV